MGKLIELKEAAKLLGISPEELTEMRDRNEVFGYRDGASWKFKTEEIERVAAQLGSSDDSADQVELAAGADAGADDLDELIDVAELKLDADDEDSESILVTEEELGRSDESTSSTIIGKAGTPLAASESDIKLADDVADELSAAESDLKIAGDSGLGDFDLSSGESDVLAGDSDLLSISDEGSDVGADSGDTGKLSLAGDEGSGKAESSLKLAGDDELSLDDEEPGTEGAESDLGALDSSVDLDLDDEDLFASSGTGSDVTLGASDSGINLANPSDSGISLEDISDLGSGIDSGIDSSLELGDSSLELGDEDMIELEGDLAESEDATELKADDEFLLTPVEGEGVPDEESDDSGSQVIALDSDEFEESAETMLVAEDGPLVEEDVDFAAAEGFDAGGATVATGTAAAAVGAAAGQDAGYSVWNVVSLGMVAAFLGISGLLVMDLIRNIWSWNGAYSLNSTIMDGILSMFGG